MERVREKIDEIERKLEAVRKSYKEVVQSSEDIEVDEDGVIVTGALGFDLGNLDDAIDYLEEDVNDVLEVFNGILDKFEEWSV